MPSTKPRIMLTVDEEVLNEIEDVRYQNRIPTRAQTVIMLMEKGLKALEREQKRKQKQEK